VTYGVDWGPGTGVSIQEYEQLWVSTRSLEELRREVYDALPSPIAANDFERRKPFLALEALVEVAGQA
jgi:hypothetical protein